MERKLSLDVLRGQGLTENPLVPCGFDGAKLS